MSFEERRGSGEGGPCRWEGVLHQGGVRVRHSGRWVWVAAGIWPGSHIKFSFCFVFKLKSIKVRLAF